MKKYILDLLYTLFEWFTFRTRPESDKDSDPGDINKEHTQIQNEDEDTILLCYQDV